MKTSDLLILGGLGAVAAYLYFKGNNSAGGSSGSAGGGGYVAGSPIPANAGDTIINLINGGSGGSTSGSGGGGGQTDFGVKTSTPTIKTSYTGFYDVGTGVYTSPQGYKMSVAPANVGAVAGKYGYTIGSPVSAVEKAQSILLAPNPLAKTAAGLGVPVSFLNPNIK